MSFQRETYNAIKSRLAAEVPELLSIDLFNNQFEDLKNDEENQEYPWRFPCAFIGLGGGFWQRDTQGLRVANPYTFRVHLGFDVYHDEHASHLDLIEKVANALDMWSWSSNGYSIKLTYTQEIIDEQRTNVVEHVLVFESYSEDTSLQTNPTDPEQTRVVTNDFIIRRID